MQLGMMLRKKLLNCLKFQNYLVEANNISSVLLRKFFTFIIYVYIFLGNERDSSLRKLKFQTLLINIFQKADTSVLVYLIKRALDRINLICIDHIHLQPLHNSYFY